MLNTERVMAHDRNTDMSARTRPVKRHEIMMPDIEYVVLSTWAYSDTNELI